MKIPFCSTHPLHTRDWIVALNRLAPGLEFEAWSPDAGPRHAELAVVWKPTEAFFRAEPGLKAIFNLGAGVDALLANPGLPAGTAVYRLEDGGMAVQIAEYAVHVVVGRARGFERYAAQRRAGVWQQRPPTLRSEWPVGVMGMGAIGSRIAQALAQLEYPVAGWSQRGRVPDGVASFAGPDALDAFLRRSRVLINMLPLTAQTQGILCRANLSKLLPDAHLINLGRGEHLVEADLLALLDEGHLGGATLDVFRTEPLPAADPLWADPRIEITPHISALTLRDETLQQVAAKITGYLAGQEVSGCVDRLRGY